MAAGSARWGATARTAFLNTAAAYFHDATSPLKGLLQALFSVAGTATEMELPHSGGVWGPARLRLPRGWDGSGPTLNFQLIP